MTKKNNIDLEKFIRWIIAIQRDIDSYSKIILQKWEDNSVSNFKLLYDHAIESYFLTILRNLIDKDSRTSSIHTFSEQFFEDEFNTLISSIKEWSYSNICFSRLEKLWKVMKKIRTKRWELYKKNKTWMNEYNSHLNTERLKKVITSEINNKWRAVTRYKKPPIWQVIGDINILLWLFQELISYLNDQSEFSCYIFNSKIEFNRKIHVTVTEI